MTQSRSHYVVYHTHIIIEVSDDCNPLHPVKSRMSKQQLKSEEKLMGKKTFSEQQRSKMTRLQKRFLVSESH